MTSPAGFHVIPLPYADDIRAIQLDDTLKGILYCICDSNSLSS